MTIAQKKSLWTGLTAGPLAWAFSTQLNYALTNWQCEHHTKVTWAAGLLLTLIALVGAFVSARALKVETGSGRLLAIIGIGLGLLTAAIILTQGAASLVVEA